MRVFLRRRPLKWLRRLDQFLFWRGRAHPSELLDRSIQSIIIAENYRIGDFLMNIPALLMVKKIFPQARLTLLVCKPVASIATRLFPADTIVPLNSPWIYGQWKGLDQIRQLIRDKSGQFDLAIDLQGSIRNSFFLKRFKPTYLLTDAQRGGRFLATHYSPPIPEVCHYSENARHMIAAISPKVGVSKSDYQSMFVVNREDITDDLSIAIHPFASHQDRVLDEGFWGQAIETLWQDFPGAKIVVISDSPRQPLVQALTSRFEKLGLVCEPLDQLVKTLQQFNLVICMDSMCGHLTALMDVPTICLILNDHPDYIRPESDQTEVVIGRELRYDAEGFLDKKTLDTPLDPDHLLNKIREKSQAILQVKVAR